MRVSNWDEMERSMASITELVTTVFVPLLREDYATKIEELTGDAALRMMLKRYACEDKGRMDSEQFIKGVTKPV